MGAYRVTAKNFSQSNENRMHSDEVAQKYGFKGALVPGVAVYGHLTHPLVEQLGESWLSKSVSKVRFIKPAYHGDQLDVTCIEDEPVITFSALTRTSCWQKCIPALINRRVQTNTRPHSTLPRNRASA